MNGDGAVVCNAAPFSFPLAERDEGAVRGADVDLARATDALLRVLVHFNPVGDPAGKAAHGKKHREHADGDAEGAVDDAGIEIDVGIELALDKVLVAERDLLQLL